MCTWQRWVSVGTFSSYYFCLHKIQCVLKCKWVGNPRRWWVCEVGQIVNPKNLLTLMVLVVWQRSTMLFPMMWPCKDVILPRRVEDPTRG